MGCNTSFAVRAFWNVTICKNKGKGANPFPCFAQNTMGLLEIYFIKLFHRLGADNAISSILTWKAPYLHSSKRGPGMKSSAMDGMYILRKTLVHLWPYGRIK